MESHPALHSVIQRCESPGAPCSELAGQVVVLCGHLFGDIPTLAREISPQLSIPSVPPYVLLSMVGTRVQQKRHLEALKVKFSWDDIRHQSMGGLTSARLQLGWYGPTQAERTVAPRFRVVPRRPLSLFLEPSVRLGAWLPLDKVRGPCWRPMDSDAKPFPWPWPAPLPWVVAPSCFFKAGLVARPLTDKERCQLLDLREDWRSGGLLDAFWSWGAGYATPLRLLSEFALGVVPWLCDNKEGQVLNENFEKEGMDWGRVRSPRLGAPHGQSTDFLGWNWAVDSAEEVMVATKSDDAAANLALWAVGGDGPKMETSRAVFRRFLFSLWIRRLTREATSWLLSAEARDEYAENRVAVIDCVRRCANSDWWEWSAGSRLMFWRWPCSLRREARDGAKGFHTGIPRPRRSFPPIPISETWIVEKDSEKLEKLLRRGYIVPGPFRNAVPRFPVPKGSDDIRVVWDLAKNGLNENMFTPSFFLPTMATLLRRLCSGSHSGDFDIGEQFHNYMLHPSEQIFCGVEIPSALRASMVIDGIDASGPMRWARLVFGWQSSPYLALRMLARAMEIAIGAPCEAGSAFAWDHVILNLPGSDQYDPGFPRVRKLTLENTPATEIVVYFDDGRVMGATESLAQAGLRQVTSRLQRLGNQDAARKRRPVSQRPGAWAGGIAYTDQGVTRKLLTQAKWDRVKDFLIWVRTNFDEPRGFERGRFRSGKGFLVHVAQTYDFVAPYLKGFHLSDDCWRIGRDTEGWKITAGTDELDDDHDAVDRDVDYDDEKFSDHTEVEPAAPSWVEPVPRLATDVETLLKFFEPSSPVQVIVRPVSGACYVAYGAGDASGEGFGSSLHPLGMAPLLRQGFWCTEATEESSNWRELRNLVDAVRVESNAGRLVGRELWLATDNSTAALSYYRGSSKSRRLHELVTELRLMTLRGNFDLHVFHISGTRMIEIGVDALSRGELHVGAIDSTPLSAAPLHLTPFDRSPALLEWMLNWVGREAKVAQSRDWFYAAHQSGTFDLEHQSSQTWIWDLPPAAAIHALEELGMARIKRHHLLKGVVVIPQLLQPEWLRRFSRVVDFYFVVPAGSISEWSSAMHEGLTIGIYLPLLRFNPWCWKRVPFMAPLGMALSRMYKEGDPGTGDLLRKFWLAHARSTGLPERMVSKLLQGNSWRQFLHLSTDR